ncbi:50S ribosomal protein L11 methyltransferase [Brucella sp. IR073]|uniref:50S ribosomal protein L11 methyltransferase n=1 Tax=unclassified Brucella TaxID=2632610 RepID=UPI003B97EFBB
MPQTRLFLTAGKEEAERIYALIEQEFEEDGLPIAIVEVDEDRQIFEVSLYVETDADPAEARIADRIGSDAFGLQIQREVLPDIDWVVYSLEGLKPVRAGRFFVHGSHDRDKIGPDDIAIEIDAAQAFGTGHHGTTSGCLEMIDEIIRRENPQSALDLGTGSAVLAIAIAKLAPIPVLATDIDPVAIEIADENLVKNGVATYVKTATATGFDHPAMRSAAPFDLIVANILALPLIELAPAMKQHMAPGGSLVLSGILDSQHDKVIAAYQAQGFSHQQTLYREGWVTIHLK